MSEQDRDKQKPSSIEINSDAEDDESSESSSVSSSASSSEINEKKLKQQIIELRQRIQANSGDFQAWLQLVRLLRQSGELDPLREVRNQFADRFPLPYGYYYYYSIY
jgi:hypothetical protein